MTVSGLCPGCTRPLADHLPSRRNVRGGGRGIEMVQGRCHGPDGPAPQKACWAALAEPSTVEEYLERYARVVPPLPPCPACGGRLGYHGKFWRRVEVRRGWTEAVPLYRGHCLRPGCPLVTVTVYPPCLSPYRQVTVQVREWAVRQREEAGRSWAQLARGTGYRPATVRAWVAGVALRAQELAAGLMQWLSYQRPQLSLIEASPLPARTGWWAWADRVAGRAFGPRLSLGRLLLLPFPSPWPVWV